MARRPSALIWLTAGLVLLLALTAAGGQGGAGQPTARFVLSSGGSLELSDSLAGGAIFSARDMAPGSSAAGTVSVSNTGSLDGAFSLSQVNVVDTPGPFGGRPSQHFQLAVEEISAGGSTAQLLYSGVLSGLGTRQLGPIRAGETRSYRFTVSFPDTGIPPAPDMGDNLFQSGSLRVDYVWTASVADPGAGSGGGGGGSVGGEGGVGDGGQASLTLTLGGKRKQRALRKRRIVVHARCSTMCRLAPSARVRKARGLGRLRSRRTAVPAGKRKRLTFKLSRRKVRVLRRVLRKRRRLVGVVKVTATAADGVKVTARSRIILVR